MPKPGILLLSALMVAMGIFHLANPKPFVAVVPPYLPAPAALVALSGLAEIAGGLGLLFPANVHMALHRSFGLPAWILWLRLPLQIPLVLWALWAARQR